MRGSNAISLYHFSRLREQLPLKRRAVLEALHSLGGKGTCFDVAEELGVSINCISGRITELKDTHLVDPVCRVERVVNGRKTTCMLYETTHFKTGRKRRLAS
jgi:predicted transcriptional regulator